MPNRLLIAAGESASGAGQLPFGITALIDAADEILVVTPTLPSRFEWLTSATDRAKEQADQRLRTVLGQLAERGTDAEGVIGADDPLLAFEDAIMEFEPDHLIIALRSGEDSDGRNADSRPAPGAVRAAHDGVLCRRRASGVGDVAGERRDRAARDRRPRTADDLNGIPATSIPEVEIDWSRLEEGRLRGVYRGREEDGDLADRVDGCYSSRTFGSMPTTSSTSVEVVVPNTAHLRGRDGSRWSQEPPPRVHGRGPTGQHVLNVPESRHEALEAAGLRE